MSYEQLFAYLAQLGFADKSPAGSERVFEHAMLQIVIAFALPEDRAMHAPVRDADVTSVEFRLQQHGLLTGPLADAVREASAANFSAKRI